MSVARSSYRQILKHIQKASRNYETTEELCFALFGIALKASDFASAGYGDTPYKVARSLFIRPLIVGDAQDTSTLRLAAGFDALKRLREIASVSPATPARLRDIHHSLNDNANGKSEEKDTEGGDDSSEREEELEKGVTVCSGTLFLESSLCRKIKKLTRHIVLSKDLRQLPPYLFMLPPEPLYPVNTRMSTRFPLMHDAMLCMAAASKMAPMRQSTRIAPIQIQSPQEFHAACASIPTRTITVTDHMEVEVRTEFVCSNHAEESPPNDANEEEHAGEPTPRSEERAREEHVFRYVVFIRNRGPARNAKRWHAQLLSRHWVIFDEEVSALVEVVGPGVLGNFPLLAPGESHTYESGTSLRGRLGVMRGTFQINTFNEDGETRWMDIHISPTRMTVGGTTAMDAADDAS